MIMFLYNINEDELEEIKEVPFKKKSLECGLVRIKILYLRRLIHSKNKSIIFTRKN